MSYWFNKLARQRGANGPAAPLKRGQGALALARQATLRRLGCAACPLNKAPIKTPKMEPTLVGQTDVYFLAEAPGRHEDEVSGKPLTGPSGKLVRECIPTGKDKVSSFDNCCNCRPPQNRTPTWQELECCSTRIVEHIEKAKPRLILGMGAIPLNWMLNSTDLSGMRGRVFAVKVGNHACWFMPTYHPSYILRIAKNKQRPLQSKLGHCFRMDIRKAFREAKRPAPKIMTIEGLRTGIKAFHEPHSFDELVLLLDKAKKAPIKAIDLETSCLRPYSDGAKLLSCALSFGSTDFAFAIDHPKTGWSPSQRKTLVAKLKDIVTDSTIKIAHNAIFELEWLAWFYGPNSVNHSAWHCTQMQAHFIDPRRGNQARGEENKRAAYQDLDFLCLQYFGFRFKKHFAVNRKNMIKSDIVEMLIYNGADTKITLNLFYKQYKVLEAEGLLAAYEDALPRQSAMALMQFFGLSVSQAVVKDTQKGLKDELDKIEGKINSLPVVKDFIQKRGVFNPLSTDDVLMLFRDFLKRKEVVVRDKVKGTEKESVDKNVLDAIDHPLAQLIIQLRNRSKLKSTYVDEFVLGSGSLIYRDEYLHPSFNSTFSETGRTSCDSPSMQNFPQRKDSWVRKQIVAPPKHLILAADYGQLEGCTSAMCSLDKVLIKALWENYDIHQEWAEKTHKLYPDVAPDGNMKACRSLIKNKLVFPAIFGAKEGSIAGYLNMPIEIINKLMREFWASFHGLKEWQDELMKTYYDKGWVASPNGRRRYYPLTRNEAINHPIQSLACDIVCDAMARLSFIASDTGQWHLHPRLNIHDDLTFVIPDSPSILDESLEIIYKTMLTPPYSVVNVPLSVKVSIGTNWGEMEEIGQFWSHKDV